MPGGGDGGGADEARSSMACSSSCARAVSGRPCRGSTARAPRRTGGSNSGSNSASGEASGAACSSTRTRTLGSRGSGSPPASPRALGRASRYGAVERVGAMGGGRWTWTHIDCGAHEHISRAAIDCHDRNSLGTNLRGAAGRKEAERGLEAACSNRFRGATARSDQA